MTLVAPQDVPQEKRLGRNAGQQLLRLVEQASVRYVGGVSVDAVHDGAVQLDSGTRIECGLVLAATGVVPNSGAAEAAGLDIEQSRVMVGADMLTSAPNIFAAGDVALAYNRTAGRRIATEHWQDAADQGAIRVRPLQASTRIGAACRASGRASATATSSTTHGVTVNESSRLLLHDDGFTVWYERAGVTVGVLTLNADDDYDLGERLIKEALAGAGRDALTDNFSAIHVTSQCMVKV